jgi:hypothetical protein
LDYLNPDYTGVSGGGSSYPNYLNLDTARIVDSILFTISAFPGIFDSYPFAWWEKQDWIENNLLVGYNTDRGKWLLFHYDRTKEFRRFTNTSYSNLDQFDKRDIAEPHLDMLMVNASYYEMVDGFEEASLVAHPWMIELFKEMAIEIGIKVIQKYLPGYGDWQSIKDAIANAGHGDWLGVLGEVLNIVKKKVPAAAALNVIYDIFDLGEDSKKVWKVFDKITELPADAMKGLIKTLKNKTGGILNKIEIDPASNQDFGRILLSPSDASDFFDDFARNVTGNLPSTFTAQNGGIGKAFDFGGVTFNFYTYPSQGTGPTIDIQFPGGYHYKLRFQ